MMKKTLTALITASALSMAMPATAQAAWWNSGGNKAEHKHEHQKKGTYGERRVLRELRLTNLQKKQIHEIRHEHQVSFRLKLNTILTFEQRKAFARLVAKQRAR